MRLRTTAITAIAALVLGVGAVAQAPMTSAQLLDAARDEVLQKVYAAAGLTSEGEAPDEAGRDGAADGQRAAASVSTVKAASATVPGGVTASAVSAAKTVRAASADADLAPGEQSEISSDDLGVEAVFSGHELEAPVSLTLSEAPGEAEARRSAVVDTAGVVVSDPIEIVALDADGAAVTDFPAEVVERPANGADEVVQDVVPGIALEFDVDLSRVEETQVDPSTLRIFTRSTADEAWSELPSYYDEETQTVKGESDHLSEFVVIGTPAPETPGPRVVLDPDNDEGVVQTPAPAMELPYNWQLVDGLRTYLMLQCNAQVVVTRTAEVPFVSRTLRAGIAAAANPVATVGFGFATLEGHGWGNESEGGTMAFSRGGGGDDALRDSFVAHMPTYTGRPAAAEPSNANFPFAEFGGLPGAYAHIEPLFLDHNYDRPVIDQGFGSIVDGAFRSLGGYLESVGFDCTDPVVGGWPAPPSQAELARWRHLGYQNYQTYGADPVSFSTGNLVESFPLFALSGPGEQSIDATLVYNAQDGRLSRVGAGWSFGLGARAQRFDDGSVMVVRGDGASFVFAGDGAGGYTGEAGTGLTLAAGDAGLLVLTNDEGESWVFDAADAWGIGELARHVDRQGNTTTLTYGLADRNVHQFAPLTSITDAAGQTVAVTNDGVGRITGFTLPDGRTWSLAYSDAGDLVSITAADGSVRSFTYDGAHRMLTATDANGVTYLVNEYDDAGRVVRQLDAESNVRTFAYADGETTYTDNEGGVAVFEYDDQARITGITDTAGEKATWQFDDTGNVTSHSDEAGRTWTYAYDDDGNLLEEVDPAGAVTTYTYTADGDVETVTDLDGGRTETSVYDERGLVTEVRQPDGTSLRYEYSAAGDLVRSILPSGAATAFAYDDRGNLVSSTDAIGRVTTYAYDAGNRLTQVIDPAGGVSAFGWDAADRLVSTTDAEGGVTTYGYDAEGRLTAATDPLGHVTAYTWDALARLVTVTDPEGGTTTFAYDGEDNLLATTDPEGGTTAFVLDEAYRSVGIVDPNGGEWERRYDETGVPTASVDPLGAETTSTLDDLGRAVATTDATGVAASVAYDDAGRVVSQTDAAGGVTTYAYDAMDRVTLVTDPAGFTTEYLYDIDGNLIGVVDRNGNPTLYEVDAAGQVLRETDATGAVTSFVYDPAGRITSITDADGRTTAIEYDRNGQQTAVVAPGGARTAFVYDRAGRLVTQTDALGAVATYTYDAASRLVTETDALGAVTTYAYDKAGRQTGVVDPTGEATAFGYDDAGQLIEVIEGYEAGADAAADVNVTTAYAYTAAGLLESITNPLGAQTAFAYDAAGRQTTETGPTGITTNTTYDAAGRVSRVSNPAGLVAAYAYDARGDIATLTRSDGEVSFEYSGAQQPIVMDDPTGTTGWVYDEVGRLLEQTDTRGNTLTSTYTAAGLRASLTYPDGTETVYTHDAAGDVVSQSTPEGVVEYAWDAENRLTGIQRPNQVSSSFEYDPLGQVTRVLHATPEPAAAPAAEADPVVPLKTDAAECRAAGTYLSERSVPAAGDEKPCVKTWDYLERRTLPEVESPVPAGASLEYTYAYDPAGKVTDSVRRITGPPFPELDEGPDAPVTPSVPEPATVPEPPSVPEPDEGPDAPETQLVETLTHAYAYDALGRLTRSEASDGETNTYGYDPAGNRTTWNVTGAPGGDSQLVAQFNAAGQLTSTTTTGANPGTATYSFDAAGSRSSQTVNGVPTSFGHDPAGRLLSTQTDGRSTSYAYDGLDRRTSVTDQTAYGSDTTGTVWDGFDPVATDSGLHGSTDLLRDPTGGVVFQAGAHEDSWVLGDMRNATATADAAGQITDLVDYADFGGAGFESTGWGSLVGNDGQPGDPTLGFDHYYARDYDTATGSWVQPDQWRGLLVRPQSLNRFAYVENDPASFSDHLGFAKKKAGKKSNYDPARDAAIAKAQQNRYVSSLNAKAGAPKAVSHSRGTTDSSHAKPVNNVTVSVHSPIDQSRAFISQVHLTVQKACKFGDTSCRGSRGGLSSQCVLVPNPMACLLDQMNGEVRRGMTPILDEIGNVTRVLGDAVVNVANLLGRQVANSWRSFTNLPASTVGMLYVGLTGGTCQAIGDGLTACGRNPGGPTTLAGLIFQSWAPPSTSAVTVGNVIYGGYEIDDLLDRPDLMKHEINHTWQWAAGGGGLGFVVPWLIGGGASPCNAMEQAAGVKGTNYDGRENECE